VRVSTELVCIGSKSMFTCIELARAVAFVCRCTRGLKIQRTIALTFRLSSMKMRQNTSDSCSGGSCCCSTLCIAVTPRTTSDINSHCFDSSAVAAAVAVALLLLLLLLVLLASLSQSSFCNDGLLCSITSCTMLTNFARICGQSRKASTVPLVMTLNMQHTRNTQQRSFTSIRASCMQASVAI
jgi:hypothetical protein